MPGRGTPWRKGGHVDETIEEADLTQNVQTKLNAGGGGIDGHAIEGQFVQFPQRAIMNFTGDGVSILDDSIDDVTEVAIPLGGNLQIIKDTTSTLSGQGGSTWSTLRPILLDGTDVGRVKIIISNIKIVNEVDVPTADIIDIGFNGLGFTTTDCKGITSDGTTVSAINTTNTGITDNIVSSINGSGTIVIDIPGRINGGGANTGIQVTISDSLHYSTFNADLNVTGYDPLNSIQLLTRGNPNRRFFVGLKTVIYAWLLDGTGKPSGPF